MGKYLNRMPEGAEVKYWRIHGKKVERLTGLVV